MRKHSHSSEGSPLRCYENRFCSSLDPDTRRRLCQACTKSTYAANSKATMNFYRHFLVVEGLCLTKRFRTSFVYRQGDFVVTPHPDESREVNLVDVSFSEGVDYDTDLDFITMTTLAFFDKGEIDALLDDPGFLRASYDNLQDLNAHIVAYLIGVGSSSAHDAVRFVLKYCAHNGIDHLTHEQIARLTGLSRTTVTSLMREVALAEPELLR